jgi:hypothetical protein
MKMRLLFVLFAIAGTVHAAEPSIRYVPATKDKPAALEVNGLAPEQLARWKEQPPDWSKVFSVRVGKAESAMLGSYRIDKDTLRFEPRFPLVPGLTYRATFGAVSAEIRIPKPAANPTTVVEQIYPTSDRLPENQLKFYLNFSAPMGRGEAYSRIRLLRADGKEVNEPFLELGEELWTPDGKRFTLFFHPGRVKRGLKPREELGPILEEGKKYTLVVDAGWPDENSNPLKSAFRKEFTAGKPDDEQPDPAKWKLHAPSAGGTTPLRLEFPKPLDHALLNRMIWPVDANGKRLDGAVRVSREETVWQFTPAKAWAAGEYRLAIDTALEDLAGNSIAKPFEVDVFRPVQQVKQHITERKFSVR